MRFRKSKLFNKILIALGACVFALSCLVVPTFAYTIDNNGIYGSNGLDINLVRNSNGDNATYYQQSGSTNQIDLWRSTATSNPNQWKVQLWRDVNNVHTFVTTYQVSTNLTTSRQTYDIFNINGMTLNDLIQIYNDRYYLRFALNDVTSDIYVEYAIADIYNYFSQFVDSTEYFTYFYVAYDVTFNGMQGGVGALTSFENIGVYLDNTKSGAFELNGYYFNKLGENFVNQESYNMGVQSQQSTINDLQSQVAALNLRVTNLISDLQVAQNSQARSLFWTIATTPFESFKTIWNVDVWGLNIGGIIIGGLMALLIVYLIKKVWK